MSLPDEPGSITPSWLIEVPLAHRGLHDEVRPENSLASFAAAVEAGYGVELDVHVSADDQPVVTHDAQLSRMTGDERAVGDLTAEELGRLRLNGSDEGVPHLADALEVLKDVPVMLELKTSRLRAGALEPAVAALLEDHPGPVCVASFSPVALRWFRRNRPDVIRVLTATSVGLNGIAAPLMRRLAELRDLPSVAPAAVSYDIVGLPHPAVQAWRDRGGTVVTWTVADEAALAKARRFADNIIFECIRPEAGVPPSA